MLLVLNQIPSFVMQPVETFVCLFVCLFVFEYFLSISIFSRRGLTKIKIRWSDFLIKVPSQRYSNWAMKFSLSEDRSGVAGVTQNWIMYRKVLKTIEPHNSMAEICNATNMQCHTYPQSCNILSPTIILG